MKKIILFIAFLFTMNASASAENETANNVSNVEAYDIKVNINSVVKYLELSKDQIEPFENVQKVFEENLKYAGYMNGNARKHMAGNAIKYSVNHMGYILSKEQMKKYLLALNLTINNRGIVYSDEKD